MMDGLEGKVGIVTGGTSGIGAAVVQRAVEMGARVALFARSGPSSPLDGAARFWRADVREYDEVVHACAEVSEAFGRLDFVVASAGLALQGTLSDGDPSTWRSVLDTNILGCANVCRAALPTMLDNGGGDLVLIGSAAGRGTHAGEPVYLASKWAVAGLAEGLRRALHGRAVRVSLVEPGIVRTPMAMSDPAISRMLAAIEPLEPEDVAAAVTFALSRPPRVSINELLMRPSHQGL
jgi:NADP-dependent 3-hydroxy acid dehydrogenase YdfG